MSDAEYRSRHSQELFIRYLDIGTLAKSLKKENLLKWAESQLRPLLHTTSWRSEAKWDKELLLQTAAFGHSSDMQFSAEVLAFLLIILTPTTKPPLYLETCISLFKDPRLSKDCPALSGWIFSFILAYGHRSTVWKEKLTREERLVLYAAQVELTKLSERPDLNTTWLINPRDPLDGLVNISCAECRSHCEFVWRSSFGQVGKLDSAIPLEDIRNLMSLSQCRNRFAILLDSDYWPCVISCGEMILPTADLYIWLLFRDMNNVYKQLVECVPSHSSNNSS